MWFREQAATWQGFSWQELTAGTVGALHLAK